MNSALRVLDATTNPAELDYYENLAQQWWKKNGVFWPLHRLNALRIQWISLQLERQLNAPPASSLVGLSVLDIGCGGGILSESLASAGAKVTAIDVVAKNLNIARKHQPNTIDIDYQLTTVKALRQQGKQFDVVFNMEVLEHVDHWQDFMADCHALIKPGGFSFIATINRHWLANVMAIWGAEYILGWLPKGTHQYDKFRRPKEVIEMMQKDNIKVLKQTGVGVNPIKKSMFLTRNNRVNYMLFAQKQLN